MRIVPDSASLLREFNRCHAPAGNEHGGEFCSDEAQVAYLSDDQFPADQKTSAAFYARKEHRIYAREKYKNTPVGKMLMAHEQGHALLDGIQPGDWAQELERDASALHEFHATSTAQTYIRFRGADATNLYSFDWIEAGADLYMEYTSGRLKDKPALTAVLRRLITDAKRLRKGKR